MLSYVDKFKPTSVDEMVLTPSIKEFFKACIKNKKLSNMTLAGPPGIGKTTIANILAKEFKADVLFIPCGIKGTIDTIRGELKEFLDSVSLCEKKIVILDEADSLSGGNSDNNAQKALRSIISDPINQDCTFILTCNYSNKLIGPIISRCPIINLQFTTKDLLERIITILKAVNVKYTKESIKSFISVASTLYPDIRKILTLLQNNTVSGELSPQVLTTDEDAPLNNFVSEILNRVNKEETVRQIMHHVVENKTTFNSDYILLESAILRSNSDLLTIKRAEKLVECLYRTGIVADQELQFLGFLCILLNKEYN